LQQLEKMSANTLFILILAIFVIGTLVLNAASIKWGLKWTGVANVSMAKALGLWLVFLLASLAASLLVGAVFFAISFIPSDLWLDVAGFALHFVVTCVVIAFVYKVRFLRAFIATIPYAVAPWLMALVAVYGIRPFVYEAFSIPTNAMAPTILGDHWEAPCPRCGAPAYGSPLEPGMPAPSSGFTAICSKEMRSVFVSKLPKEKHEGDRILVCKLITPKRWDLMVFRYPEDPSVNYVKRLVGLPGEKLAIRDGAIWINDKKMEPPTSIAGIRYSPTIEWNGQVHSGAGSQPVELGADEYFVLGDFVEQSSDSRFWQRGAPGHPPYAVPESHIVGVVINIYWPISRWTSFR
jgi:signal peptidase I